MEEAEKSSYGKDDNVAVIRSGNDSDSDTESEDDVSEYEWSFPEIAMSHFHQKKNENASVADKSQEEEDVSVSRVDGDDTPPGVPSPCSPSSTSTQDVFHDCESPNSQVTVNGQETGESSVNPPPPDLQQKSEEQYEYPQIKPESLDPANGTSGEQDANRKNYSKSVPLDPSETWDFSLQALDKNYKSQVLWIEGSFYRKLVGECLHEMHHVPCECEEKKKMAVCRLCSAVFCSNQCFKQTIRSQTGTDNGGTGELSEGTDIEPKEAEPEIGDLKIEDTVKAQKSGFQNRAPANTKLNERMNIAVVKDKTHTPYFTGRKPEFHAVPTNDRRIPQNLWPTAVHAGTSVSTKPGTHEEAQRFFHKNRAGKYSNSSLEEQQSQYMEQNSRNNNKRTHQNYSPNFDSKAGSNKFGRVSLSSGANQNVPILNSSPRSGQRKPIEPNIFPYSSTTPNVFPVVGNSKPPFSERNSSDSKRNLAEPSWQSSRNENVTKWREDARGMSHKPKDNQSMNSFSSNQYPYPLDMTPSENERPCDTSSNSSSTTSSTHRDKRNSSNDADKKPIHFDIPYTVLMSGKYMFGNSFSDFSVMPSWKLGFFQRLHLAIQQCPKKRLEECTIGSPCLVYHRSTDSENSPKAWYRALITKYDNKAPVGIYLMDLGAEAWVKAEDLYEIPEDLFKKDPLAIRVRCLNLKASNEDPDVTEQFNALVRECTVKLRITHRDNTGMFRHGCILSVQYLNKWFDAGVLLKKLLVGDTATLEDIRGEERKRCIFSFKTTTLNDDFLPIQTGIDVCITHVENAQEFYVMTKMSFDHKTRCQDMLEKLHLDTKNPVKAMKHLNHPLFCWKDNNTKKWHRVKVLEVVDLSNPVGVGAVVRKVDHGEVLTVPIWELKQLPLHLQNPSSCVYKCSIPIKPDLKRKAGDKIQANFDLVTATLRDLCREEEGRFFATSSHLLNVFSVEPSSNLHIVDLTLPGNTSLLSKLLAQGHVLSQDVLLK